MPDRQKFDFSAMKKMSKNNTAPDTRLEESEDFRQASILKKREDLIRHVKLGEMSPRRAEEHALADKLGPLRKAPDDCSTFDATMASWTLEMTASWIVTRNPRAVLRHHPPSYEGVSVWKTNAHRHLVKSKRKQLVWDEKTLATHRPGYDLVELGPTDYGQGYYDFDGKPQTFPEIDDIYPELQAHLFRGNIVAHALPKALHSTPCQIDRSLWPYAMLSVLDNGETEVEITGKRFRQLRFDALGILAMYEPHSPLTILPCKIHPWIRPTPKLEAYQVAIVQRLQKLYKVGIPDFGSEKRRDAELIRCLGPDGVTRWYGDGPPPIGKALDKANERFRMAMRRLIAKACVKETVMQSDFTRLNAGAARDLSD